jgi:hypothetical protein
MANLKYPELNQMTAGKPYPEIRFPHVTEQITKWLSGKTGLFELDLGSLAVSCSTARLAAHDDGSGDRFPRGKHFRLTVGCANHVTWTRNNLKYFHLSISSFSYILG